MIRRTTLERRTTRGASRTGAGRRRCWRFSGVLIRGVIVTSLKRKLRNFLELLLRKFYEGPTPPPRIQEEARLFALMNPHAGADEWEEFAARHADNAYRDGFVRGFEQSERDPERVVPEPDDALLDAQRHDWSLAEEDARLAKLLREGVDPSDPCPGATSEERVRFAEEQALAWGGYRVIALDPAGHPIRQEVEDE